MIIVSNFKDYYDWMANTYYDPKLKYARIERERQLTGSHLDGLRDPEEFQRRMFFNRFIIQRTYGMKHDIEPYIEISYMVVYVCGKLYPVVQVIRQQGYKKESVKTYNPQLETDFNQVVDIMVKYPKLNPFNRHAHIYLRDWVQSIIQHRTKNSAWEAISDEPIYLVKIPSDRWGVYLFENVNLREIGLGNVLDAQTLYQELSMFIGNKSSNEEIVEIEDKYKVTQKGFDPLYGFRKLPTKKR